MNESILILHATQTGNAQDLASETADQLTDAGLEVKHLDVYETDISVLKNHPVCLLFASTWGEGEPPDDAVDFYNSLDEAQDFDLSHLKFAVFGLGDSDYEEFNECGKQFDRMLEEHGGQRLLPRVDCDVDTEEVFEKWIGECKQALA